MFYSVSLFHFRKTAFAVALTMVMLASACSQRQKKPVSYDDQAAKGLVRHAIGFDLEKHDDFMLLHLIRHYNDRQDTLTYVMQEKNALIPIEYSDYEKITIPVRRIALLHSSYLSFFDFCGSLDHIAAISEARYVYNEKIYQEVQSGALPEVGYGETLDKERLLEAGIDLVLTVGFPNSPDRNGELLRELGIPVLVFSDWQETTLPGRAEWVKAIAALVGKLDKAEKKFMTIEQKYDSLSMLVSSATGLPTVICNLPFKGNWYMPGGNSYVANMLKDAGADYIFDDNNETGGVPLDFEVVYAKGLGAEYWINPDFANSVDEILAKDERLRDFEAIKTGKIFNNNRRLKRGEVNDYWESGLINPHLILADLISIFHPELLPGHELHYYKKIGS